MHDPADAHAGHAQAGQSHAGHSHGGHGHSHAPKDFGRAFAIGVALNLGFVAVEAAFGLLETDIQKRVVPGASPVG